MVAWRPAGTSSAVIVGEACREAPVPSETVLFLTADTGGGHRAAVEAIGDALERRFPGRFATAVCDPLTGAEAQPLLRRVCRSYGPLIRRAPWLWSVAFHATDTPVLRWLLRALLVRAAVSPIVGALHRHQPSVVVAAHPLAVAAAVTARGSDGPALVTVVTDLATAHGTWWHRRVDRTITPSARLLRAGRRARTGGLHARPLGIPVRGEFLGGPPRPIERATLRMALGLRTERFVVLLTAGAEGGNHLRRWVRAIGSGVRDVDVVAVCGRNAALRAELAAAAGPRLTVLGSVPNMAEWLRCADLVVSKAGPSIIAEAAALGVPMLLPAHLPGQEVGNADLAVAAGAARRVRGRRDLVRQIDALHADPAAVAAMRAAAFRYARPCAAVRIAELVADEATLARPSPPDRGESDDPAPHPDRHAAGRRATARRGPRRAGRPRDQRALAHDPDRTAR